MNRRLCCEIWVKGMERSMSDYRPRMRIRKAGNSGFDARTSESQPMGCSESYPPFPSHDVSSSTAPYSNSPKREGLSLFGSRAARQGNAPQLSFALPL